MKNLHELCGNKLENELTADVIMKKKDFPKKGLADCIVQLKIIIEKNSNLLKLAAKEFEMLRDKDVEHTGAIIKLQADLIDSKMKSCEALELSLDKTAEAVDRIKVKLQDSVKPSDKLSDKDNTSVRDNTTANKPGAVDWSKIDFSTSLKNAVSQSIKSENFKERKRVEKGNNIMIFGMQASKLDSEPYNNEPFPLESYVCNILGELEINEEDVVDVNQVKSQSDTTVAARVTLSHRALVFKALKLAKLLKSSMYSGRSTIYVTPDRTLEQQKKHKNLVKQLKEKIAVHPERRWVIRGDKITDAGRFIKESVKVIDAEVQEFYRLKCRLNNSLLNNISTT